MSTICKIDPVYREGKQRRRDAVAAFRARAVQTASGPMGEAYALIAHRLEAVRVSPRLSGAQKEWRFSRIIQSLAKL